MKTPTYVDTNLISQPVQDFYDMLQREPCLDWLALNYQSQNGTNPIDEWQMVRDQVKLISKWIHILRIAVICTCVMPVFIVVVALERHHATEHVQFACGGAALLAAVYVWCTALNQFNGLWEKLVKGWLNAEWTTKGFALDTWSLCPVLGAQDYFNLGTIILKLSIRSGDGATQVPAHVIEGAKRALLTKVRTVLDDKEAVASAYVGVGDEYRKKAKSALQLFQAFRIIPDDRGIGDYYRMIQQSSRKKNKQN